MTVVCLVAIGPLVRASLKAASTSDRQVRVYAVEKNPNAVITLRNLGKLEYFYWFKASILVAYLNG